MVRKLLAIQFIALSLVSMSAGCLYVPTDFHPVYSRENIEGVDLESIVVGETTKEDILLRFGEPDMVGAESRTYEYRWEKVKGLLFIVGGGLGGTAKDAALVIEFDAQGRVVERRFTSHTEFGCC